MLGLNAVLIGRADDGFALMERGLGIAVADGLRWAESTARYAMGCAHDALGQRVEAQAQLTWALAIRHELGVQLGVAEVLIALGRVATEQDRAHAGARLIGAGDGIRERLGLPIEPPGVTDETLDMARHDRRFTEMYAAGRRLTDDEAVALDTALPQTVSVPIQTPRATPRDRRSAHDLTPRELDVLRLLARGKSNSEIGDALFISPLTAKTHVANLLGKLMVENRAAAAAWAVQHQVI
jgi:non-specific serine/threonine protein kinase